MGGDLRLQGPRTPGKVKTMLEVRLIQGEKPREARSRVTSRGLWTSPDLSGGSSWEPAGLGL